MKGTKTFFTSAVLTALACGLSGNAQAFDKDNLTVRFRAINIAPENDSRPIKHINAPQDAVKIEDKWAPDFDLEYALSDKWALELLLTIPQRHNVEIEKSALGNNVEIGTVDHLPPTLTAKYYFSNGPVRPYVGGGLNLTFFTDSKLLNDAIDVRNTSIGPALQAGMDLYYNRNWSLSFDAKKVWIDTDLSLNGTHLARVNINPWIIGIGVGYRFGDAAPAKVAAAPAPAPAPVAPPADSDGDGVIDANDRCPTTPAGTKVDAMGCELDSDKDGVVDSKDRCPNTVAGAKVDAMGCELDSDKDGVVDRLDKCPNSPSNAKVDAVGCETVISLKGVNFETNSAVLTASSNTILDNAVVVLKQRAGAKVEVQGHTDSQGKDAYNQSLSDRRAKAVREYLIAHGVDASMLTSKGYGETQPIATNDTAEGRAENRRVDLKFL